MSTRQAPLSDDYADRNRRERVRNLVHWITSPAAHRLALDRAPTTTGNQSPSVPTCEKVPMSGCGPAPSGDSEPPGVSFEKEGPLDTRTELERSTFTTMYRHEVGGATAEELAEAAKAGSDAHEALHAVLGREEERQALVVKLIVNGEIAHAKRLANCGRQSVQLECPDTFGAAGCGHTENYVPISCDSRLCPDCGSRRQGQAVERFGDVIEEWAAPTMLRLSLPERVEPTETEIGDAVDRLREAFGKLRRRVVPTEGEHQDRRWVWADDGGEPAHHNWRASLRSEARRRARDGDTSLYRQIERWEREYVDQGRGIPMDELVSSGVYGVDAKQGEDGTVNVHLHVLCDVPFIPQAALASLWDDLTDAPVVDVRRVEERGESDREEALMETVGYAAKPPEYETYESAVAYQKALSGSKLIQPFGELHGNTPEMGGALLCENCEQTPSWWNYMGTVEGRMDTMGTTWESPSAGGSDPPG